MSLMDSYASTGRKFIRLYPKTFEVSACANFSCFSRVPSPSPPLSDKVRVRSHLNLSPAAAANTCPPGLFALRTKAPLSALTADTLGYTRGNSYSTAAPM